MTPEEKIAKELMDHLSTRPDMDENRHETDISRAASSMAKKKWAKMTPLERRLQAKKAANARWGRK